MANRGRPRASSRETLVDAATELFLEQGYDATSTTDITNRAGVSRNSFFNYFATKQDVLWASFDDQLLTLINALNLMPAIPVPRDITAIEHICLSFLEEYPIGSIPLGLSQSDALGASAEVQATSANRIQRVADAINAALNGSRPTFDRSILAMNIATQLYLTFAEWARHPAETPATEYFERARNIDRIDR